MSSHQEFVDDVLSQRFKPILEKEADSLMATIAEKSPSEISQSLDISHQLAIKTHLLSYDFPNKSMGLKAIKAFTGEAFKGLDEATFSSQGAVAAENDLRIISSVYGFLRPTDIIKPYRMEFDKKIINNITPAKFFKPKVTIEIVKEIKNGQIKDILNLLPVNAEESLDLKIIRAFAKVHKVVFKTISSDGRLKTPIAKRLKELRGIMAREIFESGIKSFEELINHESENFIYSPNDSKPGLPVFISAE